jgi:hypothetical protein
MVPSVVEVRLNPGKSFFDIPAAVKQGFFALQQRSFSPLAQLRNKLRVVVGFSHACLLYFP